MIIFEKKHENKQKKETKTCVLKTYIESNAFNYRIIYYIRVNYSFARNDH